MANDKLTPSDSAILIALMAEARAVLNTELIELYGIDVDKDRRERLNRLELIQSKRSSRTYEHVLGDRGWARIHDDLDVSSPKARAIGGALAAVHNNLRLRVLPRSGYRRLSEMFSRNEIAPRQSSGDVHARLRHAYAALAAEPGAPVALSRMRPFFADVPAEELDQALLDLSRIDDVNLLPENNQKSLTAEDKAAAIHVGGKEKHLIAIGP